MPAGTRTAPDATGAVTSTVTTLHMVDASGDNFADSIKTSATPIASEIQAWASAYQLNTQASIWKISQTWEWQGEEDPDNASTDQRNSVKQGINLLFRDIANLATQTPRVVSPIEGILQGNQDIPLLVAPLDGLVTAYLAMLTGYSLDSMQYTERRERSNNPRIKV